MPTQSFNVSRLLTALGKKNIIEMPVADTIQPTLPLGSMYGQVPVHMGSVAVAGSIVSAVVGENSSFELQCLDPGGLIIQWIIRGESTSLSFQVSDTALVWLTGGAAVVNQDFTREPSRSVMRSGNIAGIAVSNIPQLGEYIPEARFAGLYLPRGRFFQMTTGTNNSQRKATICWCGITASEGGD